LALESENAGLAAAPEPTVDTSAMEKLREENGALAKQLEDALQQLSTAQQTPSPENSAADVNTDKTAIQFEMD
jgi:hypothetical protein